MQTGARATRQDDAAQGCPQLSLTTLEAALAIDLARYRPAVVEEGSVKVWKGIAIAFVVAFGVVLVLLLLSLFQKVLPRKSASRAACCLVPLHFVVSTFLRRQINNDVRRRDLVGCV